MAEAAHEYTPNRLIHENSPYLLQHAHNPVDWYPWGEEAFARARAENKPVFLSIGYAACHWCHVMEHESFENEAIAVYLNKHFVSIKVDREERPDIDAIYMQALQLMSGQGGWPMSMFLTPEGKPFFGGTYFPPEDRYGRPGFVWLLRQIVSAWREQAQEIADSGSAIIDAIVRQPEVSATSAHPDEALLARAAATIIQQHDSVWGGFGNGPKFPMTMALDFLLRRHVRPGQKGLLTIVERTLDRMARGGVYDHIGGGFHRYSVDRQWLVPHFEKMLYDNALLAPVYFDAFRATGNRRWLKVGLETLDWALREMANPEGGFYATLDADSDGAEGTYYVWRPDEVKAVLSPRDAALFGEFYDVNIAGNWPERRGVSILNMRVPLEDFAKENGIAPNELEKSLESMRERMREARGRRAGPGRDDKVIVGWNGLMISALAQGMQVSGDERYLDAAKSATHFILNHLRGEDGELLHVWRAGRAGIRAFIDDYAMLANAMIDLYETTFDPSYLYQGRVLTEQMIERFYDTQRGGFYTTDGRDPTVIARVKEYYDGSMPSGNSAAAMALLRLAFLLGREEWRGLAWQTFTAAGSQLSERPMGHLALLAAVAFDLMPPYEIAIAGDLDDPVTQDMIDAAWKTYVPARVLAAGPEDGIALLQYRLPERPTGYVCQNRVCKEPAINGEDLRLTILEALSQ